jgi:FAD/FMN-containing dehydrogenase
MYPGGGILYVKPLTNESDQGNNETLSLFESLRNIPGVEIAFSTTVSDTWLESYTNFVQPIQAESDVVGINVIVGDRLLMKETLGDQASVDALAAYITNMSTPIVLQAVAGGVVSSLDPHSTQTSVHPGWRSALLHANFPVFDLSQQSLTAEQNATLQRTLNGIDEIIYPNGNPVAYYNEDWVGEPNWQTTWFGTNYDRLLDIKKRVDPTGVFTCNHCVGSELFGV